MERLLEQINLLKNSPVKKTIEARMKEFRKKKTNAEIFSELCFCIMTANFSAERAIAIQNKMKEGFLSLNEKQLARKLREHGHRFPNARAKHIASCQKHATDIKRILLSFNSEKEAREWLVRNVRGFGMKEASHFLRNIGYDNVAIIDFHIVDLLERNGIIKRPKTLTKKKYLEIEEKLEKLAAKAKLTLGELDLYLWFLETGKVFK
ncbi:MAG: N-glycosylase/DNA lyase [archaeon]